MNTIVIGAGRIGRGYVTSLLLLNKCNVVYFDVDSVVEQLNRVISYEIHVLGCEEKNIIHDNYEAYSFSNDKKLIECLANSDFIFTSVGGKHMQEIGKTIGKAYKELINKNNIHFQNIVTCENYVNPATILKQSILDELSPAEKEIFENNIGVSESIIVATGTGCPNPDELKNPMDTWIQNIRYLPIDKCRLKGDLPKWEYFEFKENFGNLLIQKLYTNNTSCTAMSYIGLLCGHTILCKTCNDPILSPILDELYIEINAALIDGLKIDKQSQLEFSRRAKEKYTDLDIIDPLTRIARDPIRKLKPEDRFIKPARLALSVGVKPWAIAMGIAAALFYEDESDETAGELARMRKESGISYILKNVCMLSEEEDLYKLIFEEIDDLKKRGWLNSEG